MAMAPEAPHRYVFTVEEFLRMDQAGIFGPETRVELIEGEFITMAPIGNHHQGVVNRLNRFFASRIGDGGVVSVQGPVRLGDISMPQPDLVLLQFRSDIYYSAHGRPEDILLAIEVSDTSSPYDHAVKVPLYAAYRIVELWIVDLVAGRLEVYRDPAPEGYRSLQSLGPGSVVAPQAFPELVVDLDALLGP